MWESFLDHFRADRSVSQLLRVHMTLRGSKGSVETCYRLRGCNISSLKSPSRTRSLHSQFYTFVRETERVACELKLRKPRVRGEPGE
ncbi:hypothetical protein CRG98_021667 [Punica granatum]|uniref:Uncharacterized protein n=1 Tax=Punica granatum TaxID=22663 RepID=A0A2I0JNV1_PUNGR|nr:hypothetical protein CRG98_021667 [Punica granatum]